MNGEMIIGMDRELKFGKMETSMVDNGKIISLISWYLFKPNDLAASFCPIPIDWRPALKISASNAESLNDKEIIPAKKALKLIPKITGKP